MVNLLDDRISQLYMAMLKNKASAKVIEYDNHIDIHLEWEEKDFSFTQFESCNRDGSRNPQMYRIIQKRLISFEKITRRSKKWLRKITTQKE